MIRLNEIQENKIINDGKAGEVKNVTMSVIQKSQEHPISYPDFKIVFTQQNGANIDIGLYYFQKKEYETTKDETNRLNRYLFRLMHIVKAVKGQDFAPVQEFNGAKAAIDFCIDIINKESKGKTFNIFINFGTKKYPSKKGFLEIRYRVPFISNIHSIPYIPLTKYEEDIIDKNNLNINDIITKEI